MCAKVAQNHETKEQKAKNPLNSFVISHILYTFVPDNEPLNRLVVQCREFLRPFGSKRQRR